jgi:hypothetical protein
MTVSPKRTKPATTLEDRLAAEAERLRQEAAQLSANIERGQLLPAAPADRRRHQHDGLDQLARPSTTRVRPALAVLNRSLAAPGSLVHRPATANLLQQKGSLRLHRIRAHDAALENTRDDAARTKGHALDCRRVRHRRLCRLRRDHLQVHNLNCPPLRRTRGLIS